MDSVAAAALSFSAMFPMTPSDELSHNFILRALETIDTSTMSRRAVSEFIDWLNYNSPLSPMNIDQTLASFNHPQHPNDLPQYDLYPVQRPLFDSFMPATTAYPIAQPSYSFMQPPQFNNGYYPIQQYASYVPSFQAAYPVVPVGYVDETAFLFVPDDDQTSDDEYEDLQQYAYVPSTPLMYQVPVGYVDETAIMFVPDYDQTSYDEYEDLLELQEQIGHVNLGLSEKTISNNLKTSLVPADSHLKQGEEEGEVCAVCQDEYKANDTIGSLECGHKYHANCIKQWLLHKNVCPICKATALVL